LARGPRLGPWFDRGSIGQHLQRDDAVATGDERRSGDPAAAPWSRLLVHGAERRTGRGRRDDRTHPRPHDPASLGRRVDLPGPAGPPASVGDRRRRTAAVPVPRALARPAGRREVRPDAGLRASVARGAPSASRSISGARTCSARRPSRWPCGCSTSHCSAWAPSPTPGTTDRSGSRRSGGTTSARRATSSGSTIAPRAVKGGSRRSRTPRSPPSSGRSSAAATGTRSCSRTETARGGATCVRRTSTRT
jgi:hypothetical protein